jgi:hypothetical protein
MATRRCLGGPVPAHTSTRSQGRQLAKQRVGARQNQRVVAKLASFSVEGFPPVPASTRSSSSAPNRTMPCTASPAGSPREGSLYETRPAESAQSDAASSGPGYPPAPTQGRVDCPPETPHPAHRGHRSPHPPGLDHRLGIGLGIPSGIVHHHLKMVRKPSQKGRERRSEAADFVGFARDRNRIQAWARPGSDRCARDGPEEPIGPMGFLVGSALHTRVGEIFHRHRFPIQWRPHERRVSPPAGGPSAERPQSIAAEVPPSGHLPIPSSWIVNRSWATI